jgi:hypothetical protein
VATDKQFEANRQNAQKSTGPKTPEGRAAVRLNGVKHGLTAETIVLKGESQADFTAMLDSFEAEHAPATPTEEALVVQLALANWRLRRLYHQEAGFYTCQLQSLKGMQKDLNLDDAGRMGHAAAWSESTLGLFSRQEGRLERTFYRALHELQRLRKERESNLALVKKLAAIHLTAQASARGLSRPKCPPASIRPYRKPPICNDPAPKSTIKATDYTNIMSACPPAQAE